MNHYRYSDGTTGPARDFSHDGMDYKGTFLSRRPAETEAEWVARLAVMGVIPVRYLRDYDSATFEGGYPSEAMAADGWLEISFPNPVAKTPAWNMATRDKRYFGQAETIPNGYTTEEPPDTIYASHDGTAWVIDLEAAYAEKQADISAEKVRVRDGGIEVEGVLYDTDASAMSAYTRVATFVFALNPDAEIPDWKASDGVWVTMTQALLNTLVAAGYANEAAAFSWQKGKEGELAAIMDDAGLDDAEKLAAIQAVEVVYA